MTRSRLLPLLVAPLTLLVACGGDDDTETTAAPAATELPPATELPTDTAASVLDTAPAAGDPAVPAGMTVLDAMTLTFDTPAALAGSITRTGLAAADPSSVDVRCSGDLSFLDVGYTPTSPGEMPVAMFSLTAQVDGPGTYPATFTLEAPDTPAGSFPFTEVAGGQGQVVLTGELAGTFSVDDGFGNAITGSFDCTTAPTP